MRALVYDYDVPDKMTWSANHAVPEPENIGEVQVEVIAASVNPIDWKIPEIPGLARSRKETVVGTDFSGRVVCVGEGVSGIKTGDYVYGSTNQGTLGEYAVVKQSQCAIIPNIQQFDLLEAAAYPTCAVTALQGLKIAEVIGNPKAQKILILGAAGGVGHLAVQMAAKCGSSGNHIIGVCAAEHEEFVKKLGAKETFDYTKRGFDISHCVCDVDVVLDTVSHVGFDYEPLARRCLKKSGKYVATNSPNTIDWVRASVTKTLGLNFQRTGYHLFLADVNTSDLATIVTWVVQGKLKVFVNKKFDFSEKDCFDAIDFVKAARMKGKVVLTVKGTAIGQPTKS